MTTKLRNFIILAGLSVIALVAVSLLIYVGVIDEYTAQILTLAGVNVIVALSLNLITGFTGQLALGHAGFMAIGAYAAAICVMHFHLPLFASLILGAFVTAIFGFFIGFPTLKLSGDYLAIVTLGFGEIIRVIMVNLKDLTGGAAGLKGIPSFTKDLTLQPTLSFTWVIAAMILVIVVMHNLLHSSVGRAIISIREDEIAANSMGINVFYYKMLSFTLSAFIAGLGGGLYATFFGYLNPTMFNFLKSCDFVIIVVLGGMGSITGTVISGFVLTYLQEFLRIMQDYRLVIYPFILLLIMLFRPQGLMGSHEFRLTSVFGPRAKRTAGGKEGV
jgi:branched-chain amino acid transport system permease protein